MSQAQKLERFAQREVLRNIHTMIVSDDDGGYVAFGQYHLRPGVGMFRVYNLAGYLAGEFGNKRTAISWCVADRNRQIGLAQHIKNLDCKRQQIGADLAATQRSVIGTKDCAFAEMMMTKMQPKAQLYAVLNNELEKCLNSAKYLQLRGFENETARTSGIQAN